jgi:hypothetical protein
MGIDLPNETAVICGNTMDHPFNAMNINTFIIDDRGAPWTIIITEHIIILKWVLKSPNLGASLTVPACQSGNMALGFWVRQSVEMEEPASTDCWWSIAQSQFCLPEDSQTRCRPLCQDTSLLRDAVTGRTEKTGPIPDGPSRRSRIGNLAAASSREEKKHHPSEHREPPLLWVFLVY